MLATRRRVCTMLGSTFAAALAPIPAAAVENYPSRPVQLVVPYAPGGSGDLLARLLGDAPRSVEYWVHRFEKQGLGGLPEGKRSGPQHAVDFLDLCLVQAARAGEAERRRDAREPVG